MKRRRGFTLFEIIVTGAILGALTVVALKMVVATGTQRRALTDRRLAVRAAESVMERCFAIPYAEMEEGPLSARRVEALGLPEASRVEVRVLPEGEPEDGTRIVVEVVWPDRHVEQTLSTRLTAWRFAPARDGEQERAERREPGEDRP